MIMLLSLGGLFRPQDTHQHRQLVLKDRSGKRVSGSLRAPAPLFHQIPWQPCSQPRCNLLIQAAVSSIFGQTRKLLTLGPSGTIPLCYTV